MAVGPHHDPRPADHQGRGEYLVAKLAGVGLLALAWQFRADCVWSVVLSLVLLLLGIMGLKLLGLVIDVIRRALDSSLPPPVYPLGWQPPAEWSALQTVTVIAVTIKHPTVVAAFVVDHLPARFSHL